MFNIAVKAMRSAGKFLGLSWNHTLRLRRDRKGAIYEIKNRGDYAIFRETVSTQQNSSKPVVLIVGFRLKLLRSSRIMHWLFQRVCILTTPFWSGFQGFHVKLWMVDPVTKSYLGIYDWYGKDNSLNYVTVLERVLKTVSTNDSVWYEIREEPFEEYLQKERSFVNIEITARS